MRILQECLRAENMFTKETEISQESYDKFCINARVNKEVMLIRSWFFFRRKSFIDTLLVQTIKIELIFSRARREKAKKFMNRKNKHKNQHKKTDKRTTDVTFYTCTFITYVIFIFIFAETEVLVLEIKKSI